MAGSLLLSLMGMVGTLIGSSLTAFITSRSERAKQRALEQQEERQSRRQERLQELDLRLEQHRWRREHRKLIYQEFAEKSQLARIAALDHHRSCLPGTPEAGNAEEIRLRGRTTYRDALMTSYAVELQGPEEVAAQANACLTSLRDLLNCAEDHEARSRSRALNQEDLALMDEEISARFDDAQRCLQLFIRAGRVALDRPTPPI
ncbi:hypothetical protein [Streptomyces cylindrosporus]|uniref:Uncharacterized protein n=1 Tax=Streptomyces cylindrosporus TaxID=2927583 RepID=A0ABS9XYN3_9ACTN|nr:hypothetical protein [Streptomyces cylindrosporus]MCI3270081.1 hypothetical protein [Streptomyces cylindrosporus]